MRNAPRQKFRPTELDFGDGRPERGGRGDRGGRRDLTSVARAPRETIYGRAPVSEGVATPISRGTTTGVPVSRVQTSRAPQASPKPAITSAIKKPAVAAKTTPAAKPVTAKLPVAAKTTTTKAPAKTTKAPIAAKTTTTKPVTTIKKPVVTPTKPITKPTSNLTSTLKKAAVGAGTAALVKKAIDTFTKPKTPVVKPPVNPVVKPPVTPKPPIVKPPVTPPVVKPPITSVVNKPNIGTPPFVPPKTTVKPPIMGGGTGVKPGGGAPSIKPPVGTKPPVVPKGSTAGVTGALTEDQIQAELDRVKADEEAFVAPEGAVTNADGSYSVTQDGTVTTYDKDGNIVGMEAVTDGSFGEDAGVAGGTTVTGTDTSGMTDLGEGYFADASGNIYGADGNLMYTVGADGEYVDASAVDDTNTSTYDETTYTDPETGDVYNLGADGNWTLEGGDSSFEDTTTYTDPDTGLTWNLGADGEWTQEGFDASSEDATSWTDPETGFTWNQGADGEWTQEGFDDTSYDDTSYDDTSLDTSLDTSYDDTSYDDYVDDGTDYEEAKGGSIVKKYKKNARRFEDGGLNSIYSDTDEEVQDFQNVGYNYGEFDDPSITGDQSLYSQSQPFQNTYLRSASLPSPEGFPAGFVDNGDGTATYVDDDGSTMTIDADNNIVFTTDSEGNVFNPEVGESVSGTYPDETGESVSGNYPVQGVTSSGAGNRPSFATAAAEAAVGQNTQPDQSGILDSLLNFVQENPGMAGGAIGALIASLMDQAGESESAYPSQPVDISELTSFDPRTTDFGAGMVGGRTGTGSPIVSYADYAEDVGDEIIDDRLFSDLGVSGYLREPDMNNYRDEEGNLTDQSGNLVDEYGYLLEDGGYEEEPQEEYMAEEEPAMAGGGTTHYTFGRVMNPAENLGLAEGMKRGGLSQAHTVHSHHTNPVVNNRVDFRKGSAVNGAGDGQSDDIPAWLADGEYVMDAELVSMLGNGSNKAGAKVLDKFRENIRAHKRSAPLGKIPPKAKSPLNYLKESMNG
jgi:histone H1/5